MAKKTTNRVRATPPQEPPPVETLKETPPVEAGEIIDQAKLTEKLLNDVNPADPVVASSQNAPPPDVQSESTPPPSQSFTDLPPMPWDDYELGLDGKPIRKSDGTGWRMKRGRKSSVKRVDEMGNEIAARFSSEKVGSMIALGLTSSCKMIFGPTFTPSQDELDELGTIYGMALDELGMKEPPAWVLAIILTGLYMVPRFMADADARVKGAAVVAFVKSKFTGKKAA